MTRTDELRTIAEADDWAAEELSIRSDVATAREANAREAEITRARARNSRAVLGAGRTAGSRRRLRWWRRNRWVVALGAFDAALAVALWLWLVFG